MPFCGSIKRIPPGNHPTDKNLTTFGRMNWKTGKNKIKRSDSVKATTPRYWWNTPLIRFKNKRGFTIIELMITVAILAILSAIALPVYFNYLKRAKRVEAPAALNQIKKLEDMYYLVAGEYGTLVDIGYDPAADLKYYTPVLELTLDGSGAVKGFEVTLTANLDSDPVLDTWFSNETDLPVIIISD